eukprot:Blabericola_migrator_1__4518@NODE_2407_length_2814_cov_3_574809_g1509_i0_p3_GENE_NODE_2407_length_2814_cov_3_574809_g1509_i0NODE_2407_length_2814_cov_3_574809_g1509_i0_p3_ORF_typecomplete_len150_score32_53_NODE_2407_length_2814_cov_3_574809_g1509_i017782227
MKAERRKTTKSDVCAKNCDALLSSGIALVVEFAETLPFVVLRVDSPAMYPEDPEAAPGVTPRELDVLDPDVLDPDVLEPVVDPPAVTEPDVTDPEVLALDVPDGTVSEMADTPDVPESVVVPPKEGASTSSLSSDTAVVSIRQPPSNHV